MKKPMIAIPAGSLKGEAGSPYYHTRQVDVNAILSAGGLSVLLPASLPLNEVPALVKKFDGIYLTGGGDLDPALYGEGSHDRVYGVNPERDAFEIALIREVISRDKPLLAVCRGMQTLNVACGGTLYVDIASQVPGAEKHDWWPAYKRNKLVHDVKMVEGSLLAEILGVVDLRTNSLHHQSVNQVGDGLRSTAYAADGVIEGIEQPDNHFVIGVQWHPEWLQDQETMRKLYRAFVDCC